MFVDAGVGRGPETQRRRGARELVQLLERPRSLANRRGMRYQTHLKQVAIERIYEEERRESLVDDERDRTTPARRQRSRGRGPHTTIQMTTMISSPSS
jgi:hypothetical protein